MWKKKISIKSYIFFQYKIMKRLKRTNNLYILTFHNIVLQYQDNGANKNMELKCRTSGTTSFCNPSNMEGKRGLQVCRWKRERGMSKKKTQPPSECKLIIQFKQERKEIPVGVNGSFLGNMSHSIPQREMLTQHQVSQDQRCRPTHAHDAMHQNLSCRAPRGKKIEIMSNEWQAWLMCGAGISFIYCTSFALQGFVYEVGRRSEVLAEVEGVRVLCWDAKVDAGVPVKALIPNAALFGVCCVQDVSDAKLL